MLAVLWLGNFVLMGMGSGRGEWRRRSVFWLARDGGEPLGDLAKFLIGD
jgi:hypothetical protein